MRRRKFLVTAVSAASVVGLAGCTGNSIEEYPEGLSEEGIEDVTALFGQDSEYLSSNSLQLKITTDGSRKTETDIQVSSEQERSIVVTTSDLPEGVRTSADSRKVVRYNTGEARYERSVSLQEEEVVSGPQYRKQEVDFNKAQEYYANFMQDLLTDIEFSSSEISDEGLIVYTAEGESIGTENSLSPSSEQVESTSIEIAFDKKGRPVRVDLDVVTVQQSSTRQQASQQEEDSEPETSEVRQTMEWSNYNSVEVEEPDWLEEADQQIAERRANRPDGEVGFTEESGSVTVNINSLENTETVDIAVDGELADRGVSEGQSKTYDNPTSIQVVTRTEQGRVVTIGTYPSQ